MTLDSSIFHDPRHFEPILGLADGIKLFIYYPRGGCRIPEMGSMEIREACHNMRRQCECWALVSIMA